MLRIQVQLSTKKSENFIHFKLDSLPCLSIHKKKVIAMVETIFFSQNGLAYNNVNKIFPNFLYRIDP